jgi:hypothetical protein
VGVLRSPNNAVFALVGSVEEGSGWREGVVYVRERKSALGPRPSVGMKLSFMANHVRGLFTPKC